MDSVATNIQSTVKQNFKVFHLYPTKPCVDSFLISLCTKEKNSKDIIKFYNNKATGINNILLKTLILAKEPIAERVCSMYNIYFTTAIFPHSL